MAFPVLLQTKRSHIHYSLEEKDNNHWVLKISRHMKKIELPKAEFQSFTLQIWDDEIFGQFLTELVQRGLLFKKDVPPVLPPFLAACIQSIEGVAGDRDEAIGELEKKLDAKENRELETLQRQVQSAERQCLEAAERQQQLQGELQLSLGGLNTLLENAFSSFEYLTYGWGQFEEFEIKPAEEEGELRGEFWVVREALGSLTIAPFGKVRASLLLGDIQKTLTTIIGGKSEEYKENKKRILLLKEWLHQLQTLFRDLVSTTTQDNIIDSLNDFIIWLTEYIDKWDARINFDKQLAEKEVINALDEYDLTDPEKFIQDFKELSQRFVQELPLLKPDLDAEVFDVQEIIEEVMKPLQERLQLLVDALDNKSGSFDEWDSNAIFVFRVLEKESEGFGAIHTLIVDLKRHLKHLHKLFEGTRETKKDYSGKQEAYLKAHIQLMRLLKNLKKEKKTQKSSNSVKEFVATPHPKHLADLEKPSFDRVIALCRKRRLLDKERGSDRKKLKGEREKKRQQIDEAIKNREDAVDLAIEWTRLNRRSVSLSKS